MQCLNLCLCVRVCVFLLCWFCCLQKHTRKYGYRSLICTTISLSGTIRFIENHFAFILYVVILPDADDFCLFLFLFVCFYFASSLLCCCYWSMIIQIILYVKRNWVNHICLYGRFWCVLFIRLRDASTGVVPMFIVVMCWDMILNSSIHLYMYVWACEYVRHTALLSTKLTNGDNFQHTHSSQSIRLKMTVMQIYATFYYILKNDFRFESSIRMWWCFIGKKIDFFFAQTRI